MTHWRRERRHRCLFIADRRDRARRVQALGKIMKKICFVVCRR